MTATLVLVHGAWHGSWCWQLLAGSLGDAPLATVDLSSAGDDPATRGDLYSDAATLQSVLSGINGPTVVLGHSYGGAVITEAVRADSGVAHLVYLSAFLLDEGESVVSAAGGTVPPWCEVRGDHLLAHTPQEVFYNDVPPQLAEQAIARLTAQSPVTFTQPVTNAGWKAVPSTYIICEQDQSVPPPMQEAMAQHAGQVLRINTRHSPFLSQPEALAELLRPILQRAG